MTVLLNRTGRMYNHRPVVGLTTTFLDAGFDSGVVASNVRTISGLDTSGQSGTDDIFVLIGYYLNSGAAGIASVTIGGNSMTFITNTSRDEVAFDPSATAYRLTGTSLGATSDVVVTGTSGNTIYDCGVAVFSASSVTTVVGENRRASATNVDITWNVSEGDCIMALSNGKISSGTYTWTNLTERWDALNPRNSRTVSAASENNLSANASYTTEAVPSASGLHGMAAVKVS